MNEYDEEILHYFLEHQTQLFPEAVAEGYLMLARAERHARGVGLVRITQIHAVEHAADEEGNGMERAVTHAAVNPVALLGVAQQRGDVAAEVYAVVAQ